MCEVNPLPGHFSCLPWAVYLDQGNSWKLFHWSSLPAHSPVWMFSLKGVYKRLVVFCKTNSVFSVSFCLKYVLPFASSFDMSSATQTQKSWHRYSFWWQVSQSHHPQSVMSVMTLHPSTCLKHAYFLNTFTQNKLRKLYSKIPPPIGQKRKKAKSNTRQPPHAVCFLFPLLSSFLFWNNVFPLITLCTHRPLSTVYKYLPLLQGSQNSPSSS